MAASSSGLLEIAARSLSWAPDVASRSGPTADRARGFPRRPFRHGEPASASPCSADLSEVPSTRRAMTRSSISRSHGRRCRLLSSTGFSGLNPAPLSAPDRMFCAVGHLLFDVRSMFSPRRILPVASWMWRRALSRCPAGSASSSAMLIGRRFVTTIKATVPAAGIAGGTRSPSRMAAESTAIYSRQSARRLTEGKFSQRQRIAPAAIASRSNGSNLRKRCFARPKLSS